MNISASLVLFHNDHSVYVRAIESFLNGCNGILYIIDNSSIPLKCSYFEHPRIMYYFANKNLGFGKAHNLALTFAANTSDYHLYLNPDVSFDSNVLPDLLNIMISNPTYGAVMPRIVYSDGSIQRLCKLLPTPFGLFLRRFIPIKWIQNHLNYRYELHFLDQNIPTEVPALSGCFLLVKTNLLLNINGFDERFFMYMEDVDLVRRIGDQAETIYHPSVVVQHLYAKGSYRNKKLLFFHLKSAILYFIKWGWFFDNIRSQRNKKILSKRKL